MDKKEQEELEKEEEDCIKAGVNHPAELGEI